MRVAVISDVHGNARALEAVLATLEHDRPEAIWCLGDTVGYGARPNDCCALVQAMSDLTLAGNHDLVVARGRLLLKGRLEGPARVRLRPARARLKEVALRAARPDHDGHSARRQMMKREQALV